MKKPLYQSKKKDGTIPARVLVATENRHKIREIGGLLGDGCKMFTLGQAGLQPRFRETGSTFEANARLKVLAALRSLKTTGNPLRIEWVMADDSGLCVNELDGRPGVRSARYAGVQAGDRQNRARLLRVMKGQTRRQARFVCVVVLASVSAGGVVRTFRGVVEGRISQQEFGRHGFGYDPVFVPRGLTRTFGELGARTKARMSHRAAALKKVKQWIKKRQRRASAPVLPRSIRY